MKSEIIKEVLKEIKEQKNIAEQKAYSFEKNLLQNENYINLQNKKGELIFEIGKQKFLEKNVENLEKQLTQIEKEIEKFFKSNNLNSNMVKPSFYYEHFNEPIKLKNGNYSNFVNKLVSIKVLEKSNINISKMPSFETVKFDVFDAEIRSKVSNMYSKMNEYVSDLKKSEKKTITLMGNPGVGKTFLTECMVRKSIEMGNYTVYVTAFAFINDMLKYHMASIEKKPSIIEKYLNCDLLVIDDIGSEPVYNNITDEYYYLIVNERISTEKNTVFTTNLGYEKLREFVGERVFSRISNKQISITVDFKGNDLRLKV